jgi:hypothetical protein
MLKILLVLLQADTMSAFDNSALNDLRFFSEISSLSSEKNPLRSFRVCLWANYKCGCLRHYSTNIVIKLATLLADYSLFSARQWNKITPEFGDKKGTRWGPADGMFCLGNCFQRTYVPVTSFCTHACRCPSIHLIWMSKYSPLNSAYVRRSVGRVAMTANQRLSWGACSTSQSCNGLAQLSACYVCILDCSCIRLCA